MTSFKDDFSTYPDGDLDNCGLWWNFYFNPIRYPIWVKSVSDYVYGLGSWETSHYIHPSGLKTSDSNRKAYMKVQCKILEDYGWIQCGFGEDFGDTNYYIDTGFNLIVDGAEIYFRRIINGAYSSYTWGAYSGELITIEMENNYGNGMYSYIKCDYPSIDLTNVSGTPDQTPPVPYRFHIQTQSGTSDKCQIHYTEVKTFAGLPGYLKNPRWQKTRYGMRPHY